MDSPSSPSHATSPKKRVLLVDDDVGVRETLGRVLVSEHFDVIFAADGNEAAAQFVAGRPHIILLDLNMPVRGGWSAFRFMHTARPAVPVVVITARPNQHPQASELGVDALMEKPLDLAVLLRAIEALLSETDTERANRRTNPDFKAANLNVASRWI
ncbi:MAG TPA: response regulator [Candidatus Limnocylindria bacterium]|nr:response regulator [Candidatus Limnocylindria bacterium]